MSALSLPRYLPVPRLLLFLAIVALGLVASALTVGLLAQLAAGPGSLTEPLLTAPFRWQSLSAAA